MNGASLKGFLKKVLEAENVRVVTFFLLATILLFPSYAICGEDFKAATERREDSIVTLPQFEEIFEVLVPFMNKGTEGIVDVIGIGKAMIPSRTSPFVTISDKPIVEIMDVETSRRLSYFGPKMVTWETNDFPLQMARGIQIGMTVAEVQERLFHEQAGSIASVSTCEVGLWYKLDAGNVTYIHLVSGNGELRIETSLQFTEGELSEIKIFVTETPSDDDAE